MLFQLCAGVQARVDRDLCAVLCGLLPLCVCLSCLCAGCCWPLWPVCYARGLWRDQQPLCCGQRTWDCQMPSSISSLSLCSFSGLSPVLVFASLQLSPRITVTGMSGSSVQEALLLARGYGPSACWTVNAECVASVTVMAPTCCWSPQGDGCSHCLQSCMSAQQLYGSLVCYPATVQPCWPAY